MRKHVHSAGERRSGWPDMMARLPPSLAPAKLQCVYARKSHGDGMEMAMEADAGFGVVPLEQVRALDGLDLFKGLMEGRFPAPPIAKVLGFQVAEVERSRVVFTYTPVFGHYNPLGTVHGGVAATLLDSVMGCCVHTTLKAGIGYTTVEIKVRSEEHTSELQSPCNLVCRLLLE